MERGSKMTKIWVKVMLDHKIKTSKVFESNAPLNEESFFDLLRQATKFFDIATPVVLAMHYDNFLQFNTTTFLPRDFVEVINFDKLILENAIEKTKGKITHY